MRYQFLLFVLLLLSSISKVASNDINAMLLEGPSGFRSTILLDDQPVVTFSDDYLVLTTHMGDAVSIPSSLVSKYTYVRDEEATDITDSARFGSSLSFDGRCIGMTNLAPSTGVQVFTVDGALVSSVMTDSHGNVSLSLPERSGTAYLVKTPIITFKISKL